MPIAHAEDEDGTRTEIHVRRLEEGDSVPFLHLIVGGKPHYTVSGREGYWQDDENGQPVPAEYCTGSVKVISLTVPGVPTTLSYVQVGCDSCAFETMTDGMVIDN